MSSVHSVDKLRNAEDEDAFLYGDEKPREIREGRDPRKRKRQSSEAGNFDSALEKEEKGKETWYKEEFADRRKKDYEKENREEKRSRSRERRRRSRSDSPDYREDERRGRRREDPDDWKRKSDAFLQSLNVAHPGQQPETRVGERSRTSNSSLDRNKIQTMMGNTGTSQTQPTQMGMSGGYASYTYPPPQMNQYAGGGGGYTAPASQYIAPPSAMGQQGSGYPTSQSQSQERRRPEQERDRGGERRDWSDDKGREEKKRNDARKDTDDSSEEERDKKQKSNVPLSVEQRDKLVKQKEQYEKAAEKLEDQLLKLKEQREALKQQGQKHEDNIMKENAKLQKEVKYRIQYMKDYMDKIDKGLEEDLKKQQAETNRHPKEVEPERQDRQPREFERELVERDRREERPSGGGSLERSRERERDGKVPESRNRERSLSRERENAITESRSRDKREGSKEPRREKTVRSREDSLSGSEKKSKKKKKKKAKERSSSSSESDQEHVKKKKKKRKAKSRERSSETESGSDSEGGKKAKGKKDKKGVIHMDEDVFRMVADLKGSKKRTGGHSEDMLMDLLGKMSEAYMKTKQENNELASRCKILENQNTDLRKKLEESKVDQSRPREEQQQQQTRAREEQPRMRMREEQTRMKEERGGFGEETRVVRALEEIREVKIKQEKVREIVAPPSVKVSKNANMEPLGARKMGRSKWDQGPNEVTLDPALAMAVPPPSSSNSMEYRPESPSRDEDYTKSVRSRMMEKESKEEDKEVKDDREDKYGREEERHHRREKRERSKERYRDRRESGEKRRERSRSGERRRDRSRSRDRRRERSGEEKDRRRGRDTVSGERSSVSKMRDKNDKIDLEEWVKPPETEGNKDPTLLSLKEKIKEKEAIAQEREDRRNRWVTTEPPAPVAPPQPIQHKQTEQPIPENRPQVAMQWGQTIKKIPDQQLAAKKAVPVVGKMPWLKRGGSAEYGGAAAPANTAAAGATRVSKFGPPVSGVNMAVPPPTLVTLAPTLATSSQPAPPGAISMPPVGMAVPPPGFSAPPLPPVPAPPPRPRINRNPTPQSMDMNAMLAAAHRHMQSRFGGVPPLPVPVPEPELSIPLPCDMPGMPPPRQQHRDDNMDLEYDTGPDLPALPAPDAPNNQPAPDVPGEISIPLPPLPAAHDKDRLAHCDTRPARIPSPGPVIDKTELDEMLEKHGGSGNANLPPGFAGPDKADLVTGHVWQGAGGVYDYADIPEPDNRPVEHNGSPVDDGGPDAEELRMMGIDPEDAVLS